MIGLGGAAPAVAQSSEQDVEETAKPADSVSPYGVSYTTGAFTYSVPLFTIGNGDWPNKITVSLNYDSSGNREPNGAWSVSTTGRASGTFTRFVTGFEGEPLEEYHEYGAHLVLGGRSRSFELDKSPLDPTMFRPASIDGSTISFAPGSFGYHGGIYFEQHGEFTVVDGSGSELKISGGISNAELRFSNGPKLTLSDGNVVYYGHTPYSSPLATSERTNSGLYVMRDGNSICAFNLADIDLATISSCSQSSLVATFTSQTFSGDYKSYITSITRPDGGTYNFEYDQYSGGSEIFGDNLLASRTRYHLACVKEPGSSVCAVDNTYDPCDGYGHAGSQTPEDVEWTGSRDRVIQQNLPDGRVVTYSYPGQASPCRGVGSVNITEAGVTTSVHLGGQPGSKDNSKAVVSVVDPFQRTVTYIWSGANPAATKLGRHHQISEITYPEGNKLKYSFDARGNQIEARAIAKPGSGLADIVTTASYPTPCTAAKTCNKPISTTDARGNSTSYTYSSVHGGILTLVGPAVDGVSPATKYYYVQREAWLKSGTGYAKSGEPIWLLSEVRSCKTSTLNLSTGACAAGSSDLVRTLYEYGPDSGPNNLWLRGVAVVADGQTQRTCFSYDTLGRKISETQPKAGLISCP